MAGRPSKKEDINVNQLIDLARHQWTNKEIAAHFEIDAGTLVTHFSKELQSGRLQGVGNIRDMLWLRAKSSDKVLLHLADRVLGPIPKLHREITKEEAIEVLENELKREGVQPTPSLEEVAHAIDEPELNF